MRNMIKLGVIAFMCLAVVNACKSKKRTEKSAEVKPKSACASMVVTYTSHVKGIIDQRCAGGCHSAKNHAGGIDLSTYETVKEEAVKARFMGAINHDMPFSPMPKKGAKLTDSTIMILNCWIEQGSIQ